MVKYSPALDSTFGALADPTRRAILEMLRAGSRPVHAIASGFPISRPAISKHLRILKEAVTNNRLIECRLCLHPV